MIHGEMEFVITRGGVGLFRSIAEDLLVAEFGVNFGVDLVERFFLGDFEETRAGGFGHFFEDFFAIGA